MSTAPGTAPITVTTPVGSTATSGAGTQPVASATNDVRDSNGLLVNPTGAAFDRNTGKSLAGPITTSGSTTDPTATSTGQRSTYDALGNNITSMYNTSSIQNNADQEAALLKSYQDKLDSNFQGDTTGIKAAYDQAAQQLEQNQAKRYAGQSTALVTSGGGFLGNTGSHSGVLNSLNDTFFQEHQALMSKRDTALQQARDAYDNKNFDLAKSQLDIARQAQQDIYSRQKDQNDYQLQIAQENRAQNTYVQQQADKQAASIASMTPEQYAKVDPALIKKIDDSYYSGYTKQLHETTQKAAAVKTAQDAVDLESKIIDMRSKIPAGQKFTVNGQTYTGLKTAPVASAGSQAQTIISQISAAFSTPGTTIKGTDGIPFSDKNGYATPEGWNAAAAASGLPRKTFIAEFGYLLPPDDVSNSKYKLSPAEQALIKNDSKNPAPIVINTGGQ